MTHVWWTRRGLLLALLQVVILPAIVLASVGLADARRDHVQELTIVRLEELPREARETLALIKHGGPFPYKQDGSVFGNRERRLPLRPNGYYHEYTVPTRGARDRGPRRIITGEPGEYYYSDDHYNTFRRIRE